MPVPINFLTPNITLVSYQKGAGGHFLLNCISLSKQSVMHCADLAKKQLVGNLLPAQKHQLLLDRLSLIQDAWDDLRLGNFEMFGFPPTLYTERHTELPQLFGFNPLIGKLTNTTNLKFGLTSHSSLMLKRQLEVWKNGTVLILKNPNNFLKRYRPNALYGNYNWQQWTSLSESEPPRTIQEFQKLDVGVKQLMINQGYSPNILFDHDDLDREQTLNTKIQQQIASTNRTLTWDCDWFLNIDQTVYYVQELYTQLELDDFNADLISSYHSAWVDKMSELKFLR